MCCLIWAFDKRIVARNAVLYRNDVPTSEELLFYGVATVISIKIAQVPTI